MLDLSGLQDADPLQLFDRWFAEAEQSEPNDPNAAALATSSMDGVPSARMVLAKRVQEERFCFFTNANSLKGAQLRENPHAALCFHWKSLRRQVRVQGAVSELHPDAVDTYFYSRSRASQIGAAVSQQSRELSSREVFERAVNEFAARHPDRIPRPDFWRGFRIEPEQIEFWADGAHRLHHRVLFVRENEAWSRTLLYP